MFTTNPIYGKIQREIHYFLYINFIIDLFFKFNLNSCPKIWYFLIRIQIKFEKVFFKKLKLSILKKYF